MKYNKHRYLSKNNQNTKRIDYLIKNYPNSKIIIPFREPTQHAFSLYNQHKKFISLQKKDDFNRKYMFWIGHSEFGTDYNCISKNNIVYENSNEFNHWLEQWYLSYKMLKQYKKSSNVFFVCYEKLCRDSLVFESILDFIRVESRLNFDFHESKKYINVSYDKGLSSKCESLYRELIPLVK